MLQNLEHINKIERKHLINYYTHSWLKKETLSIPGREHPQFDFKNWLKTTVNIILMVRKLETF